MEKSIDDVLKSHKRYVDIENKDTRDSLNVDGKIMTFYVGKSLNYFFEL